MRLLGEILVGGTFPEKRLFFVWMCKRIIAHLSSHKMPLSLSNGNINFFCILDSRVMLTSPLSLGCLCVCVWRKDWVCRCMHVCVHIVCVWAHVCWTVCTYWLLIVGFKLRGGYKTREDFSGLGTLCGRRRRVRWRSDWEGSWGGGHFSSVWMFVSQASAMRE